ncbi:MAG: hypothetical protein ACE5HD_03770 [Acidobacteriota bacterium]
MAPPILGVTLAAFAGALSGGTLYFRDLILLHRPVRVAIRRLWRAGIVPLWDPWQDGGRVLLANPNHQVLHPTALLDLFFSVDTALAAAMVVQVFLAGWGLALFLKDRGATPAAARMGGMTYALSGPVLSLGNLPNLMGSIAWVPLVLWAGCRAFRSPGLWVPLAAFLAAIPALSGGVESLGVAALILGALALWHPDRLRRLGITASITVGGLMLAAVQLLPAWETLRDSERGLGFQPDQIFYWSFSPIRFLEAAIPRLWGLPTDRAAWWGEAVFDGGWPLILSTYLGAGVLVLAGVGGSVAIGRFVGRAGRFRRMAAARLPDEMWQSTLVAGWTGTGLMLLALGRHNPLLTLWGGLPRAGGAILRYPERLVPLAVLAVAVAAAAGWQVLAAARQEKEALPRSWWMAAATMVLLLGLAGAMARWAGLHPVGLYQPALSARAAAALVLPVVKAVAGLWVVAVCVWMAGRPRRESLAAGLLFLALSADLLAANGALNPTMDPGLMASEPAAARFLASLESSDRPEERPCVVRGVEPRGPWAAAPSGEAAVWSRHSLALRIPEEFGLATSLTRDVDRSTPLGNAYLRVAHRQATGASRERLADRAGASWELGFDPGPSPIPAGAPFHQKVLPGAPAVVLWPRPDAAPRISIVPRGIALGRLAAPGGLQRLLARLGDPGSDPRREVFLSGRQSRPVEGHWEPAAGRADLVVETPLHLEIATQAPGPGVLVVRDSLARGWQARLDGRRVEVVRADLAWRGVVLPAGLHRVSFVYRQPGLVAGTACSAMALAVLLGVAGRSVRRHGRWQAARQAENGRRAA